MRIATCIAPLKLHCSGNKTSVAIGEGWTGDLDHVVGVDGNGKPTTVADCLGDKLMPANFRLEPPARKGPQPKDQE